MDSHVEPNEYPHSREKCGFCKNNLFELPWGIGKIQRVNVCLNAYCPRYRNPAGFVYSREKMIFLKKGLPDLQEENSLDDLAYDLREIRKNRRL